MLLHRSALLLTFLVAALGAGGCATQSDIDMTIDEINQIRSEQAIMQKQLMGRIQDKSKQLESDQSNLDAAQTEFRSEAEGMRGELAETGSSVAELRRQVAELRQQVTELVGKVKALQHNQAVGLGSLSNRIDAGNDGLTGRIDDQTKKMDSFATQVSGQVDKQVQQLTQLTKGQRAIKARDKKRDKTLSDLSATLATLGKKLTAELATQSKRIQSKPSAGKSADVAALKKKVDFLGKKLPGQIDKIGKQTAGVSSELHDYQSLLADLNKRLKALEAR